MEQGLEEALKLKTKELRVVLLELKQHDIQANVTKLQSSLPKNNRCTICTLKLPCKHYSSIQEMPKPSPQKIRTKTLEDKFDLSNFSEFANKKKTEFTVNFRGREWKFSVEAGAKPKFWKDQLRQSLLSSIERYKETKLISELDRIERWKKEESEKNEEKEWFEMENRRYWSKQREKVGKYKEDMRNSVRMYIQNEKNKEAGRQEKLKKYYEHKKKVIQQYREENSSGQMLMGSFNNLDY